MPMMNCYLQQIELINCKSLSQSAFACSLPWICALARHLQIVILAQVSSSKVFFGAGFVFSKERVWAFIESNAFEICEGNI